MPISRKYGEIMLDANAFFQDFEARLRQSLPSLDVYRMRSANNDLVISLRDESEFLAIVRAASSANIALEIGWLFDSERRGEPGLASCYLRLQLSAGCVDERLNVLLAALQLEGAQPET